MKTTTLWKFDKTTGYWVFGRTCDIDTAQDWLKVWQESEPDQRFKISKNKPRS